MAATQILPASGRPRKHLELRAADLIRTQA